MLPHAFHHFFGYLLLRQVVRQPVRAKKQHLPLPEGVFRVVRLHPGSDPDGPGDVVLLGVGVRLSTSIWTIEWSLVSCKVSPPWTR